MSSFEIANRYRVIALIRRTFRHRVYLADDLLTGQKLAIKLNNSPSADASDSLKAEFEFLYSLQHHQLPRPVSFGTCPVHGTYLSMEYLGDLTLLEARGRISDYQLAVVYYQIAHALDFLHRQSVLHGDITPENIMIASFNRHHNAVEPACSFAVLDDSTDIRACLIDFDLAVRGGAQPGSPEVPLHCPRPPEILAGESYTQQTDVYALAWTIRSVITNADWRPHAETRTDSHCSNGEPPIEFRHRFLELIDQALRSDAPQRVSPSQTLRSLDELLCEYGFTLPPSYAAALITTPRLKHCAPHFDSLKTLIDAIASDTSSAHTLVPRMLFLAGEQGSGRSRLLEDMERYTQLRGIQTLFANRSSASSTYLHSLAAQLRSHLKLRQPANAERTPHSPDPGNYWYVTYLPFATSEPTLDVEPPQKPPLEHDGFPAEKPSTIQHLVNELCTLLSKRKVAIFLDDIHTAEPELLELLRLLSQESTGPIVVSTYLTSLEVPGPIDAFIRLMKSRAVVLTETLQSLSAASLEDHLNALFAPDYFIGRLREHLLDLTGGNPLLISETLLSLVESGELSRRAGSWHYDCTDIDSLELPDNLLRSASTLLNSLPDRYRRILLFLAVAGSAIDIHRIADATRRDSTSLRVDLRYLTSIGLLRHVGPKERDDYAIAYGYVRLFIYRASDTDERRLLHRRLGEMLERSYDEGQSGLEEQIAHHYLEALSQDKGPEYAFRAAFRSMERFATHRAIQLLIRGIDLIPSADRERRFRGLETVAALLAQGGDIARAIMYYREMLFLARTAGDPRREAIAVREIGELLTESGELERGMLYAQDAEVKCKQLADKAGEARAIGIQCQAKRRMGQLEKALESANLCYSTALESQDVYIQSLARNLQGLIAMDQGDAELAIQLLSDSLQLKTQINDLCGIPITLSNIGLVYLEQNRLIEAQPYFERALCESREKGLSLPAILALINLGEIHRLRGEFVAAEAMFKEGLVLADGSGRRQFTTYILYSLGLSSLLVGRYGTCISYLEQAAKRGMESGTRSDLCLVHVVRVHLLLALGDLGEARLELDRAFDISRRAKVPQLTSATACAEMLLSAASHAIVVNAESYESHVQLARNQRRQGDLCALLTSWVERYIKDGAFAEYLDKLSELRAVTSSSGLRPALAKASLLEGQALLKLQRRVEARLVLQEGVAMAREMGLKPLLSHLLYWLGQAQEAAGDAPAAADCYFESAELIRSMAADISDEVMRRSYLEVPANLAAVQRAERLERAGFRPRPQPGARPLDPGEAATKAWVEVLRHSGGEASVRTVLTSMLDRAIEAIRADRGLLILLDNPDAEVTIARNLEGETIRDAADYSRTVLGDVRRGEPVLVMDVGRDERFRGRESVTLYHIESLMCVPLRLGDRVLGAVYLDTRSGDRSFREDDLRLVEAFAARMAAGIAEAQDNQRQREVAIVLNKELARRYHIDNLIGESPAMHRLFRMMEAVTRADCNVLVVGESGTGKELVARAIHFGGSRRLFNFVPLDCGALPEGLIESELFGYRKGAFSGAESDKKGLFEEADDGTLFLDEITNTTLSFQAKLLRALQSGEFRRLGDTLTRRADVRIIAATNADVDLAMREGRFREDLYYRLNVVTLNLPPLRQRREDIPLLAEHFAKVSCQARGVAYEGIGRGALTRLTAYGWPGNVRELEHAVQAALVVSGDGMVRRECLPERILGSSLDAVRDLLNAEAPADGEPAAETASIAAAARSAPEPGPPLHSVPEAPPVTGRRELERELVRDALSRAGGDKSRAARLLGWNRMKLYRRMRSLGIPYDTGRDSA